MIDFSMEVLAGLTGTGIIGSTNYLGRGLLWPLFKTRVQDNPNYSGRWIASLPGASGESFRLYLAINHYAPYVRGGMEIEKTKDGKITSTSKLKITGYICDNHISIACRTKIKDRRSISTLFLRICDQSVSLNGQYSFKALDTGALVTREVKFDRTKERTG